MPRRVRRLSGRDVLRALGAFDFEIVATRGSHAKLRRVLRDGTRQTLTVPLHRSLAEGTLHAIFRQACRFVPEKDLRRWFFTGD
jgi:predicted RNA binding protein YcfA (HicA-like mRNA interferase family)